MFVHLPCSFWSWTLSQEGKDRASLSDPVVRVSQVGKARRSLCVCYEATSERGAEIVDSGCPCVAVNSTWGASPRGYKAATSGLKLEVMQGKKIESEVFSPHCEDHSQYPYNQTSLINSSDFSFMWHGAFRMKTHRQGRKYLLYTWTPWSRVICKKCEWAEREVVGEARGRNQWASQTGTLLVSWCRHCFFLGTR